MKVPDSIVSLAGAVIIGLQAWTLTEVVNQGKDIVALKTAVSLGQTMAINEISDAPQPPTPEHGALAVTQRAGR